MSYVQIETLKTKLIGANAGVWQGTKMILAKEGIRGVYQGLTATILKAVRHIVVVCASVGASEHT